MAKKKKATKQSPKFIRQKMPRRFKGTLLDPEAVPHLCASRSNFSTIEHALRCELYKLWLPK